MAMVRQWTAQEVRALREAMRLGVRDFAARLGVADRTVAKWESRSVRAQLRPSSNALLDRMLQTLDRDSIERFELALVPPGGTAERAARAPGTDTLSDTPPASQRDKQMPKWHEVPRRQVLEGLAAVSGIAVLRPPASLELLRHALIQEVAGHASSDIDEWEAIAFEYGYSYAVIPPAELLDNLEVDLAVALEQLGRMTDGPLLHRMHRIVAVLEAFVAQSWGNLGNTQMARRWWRAARLTADRSTDPATRTWVRGREIIRGLHEGWPLATVLSLADEAVASSTSPSMGTGSVYMGRAQTLAMLGRTLEARSAVEATYEVMDRLPDSVTGDVTSMYGWPEYRLRHGESFVYTYLGDAARATEAQHRAMALYPPHMFRERAQVQLHRAICMVKDGDVGDGAAQACSLVTALPADQRIDAVLAVARAVVDAVPIQQCMAPEVVMLRDLLRPPAAPARQ